jgi:hypothetical protein
MSKTKNYRQCKLRNGNVETTSYIPEQHAYVGRNLMLKREGEWEEGWKVESAGELVPAEVAEALANAFEKIWKPSTLLTTKGHK